MRISQGYVSKSVMDFPFHQIYSLDDYRDNIEPAVFFGLYRYEDFMLAYQHLGQKVFFWTGQDALDCQAWEVVKFTEARNVTAHPKIAELISSKGLTCELVNPSSFLNEVTPQRLGSKIYTYCPSSASEYHGGKIIDELKERGYDIIVGNGYYSQQTWREIAGRLHYSQCFIGLCLSEFAGGGTSIIEMGLRGMRVVTNVFNLSHCIPWDSVEDVAASIEHERKMIGTTNDGIAKLVYKELDHEFKWLEL